MDEANNNIEFWDYSEQENLRFTDEDEAIECLIDEMELPYPETITIAGYARMELGDLSYHDVLSNLLESIDESYGNPEEMTEPTPAMKEAEKAFLAVIEKEYFVWTCKEVCRKKINVAEWIKENRPDLIEDKKEE